MNTDSTGGAQGLRVPDFGHRLDPGLHRALRNRPPQDSLEWVRTTVGARAVVRVRALPGGQSSAVHLVTLETARGTQLRVVLRRYVLDWVSEEPYAPGNEAAVLRLLRDTAIAAPELVAADPDGSLTGTPALVMSALPGRVVWDPADVEDWLQRLAAAVVSVHAVPPDSSLSEWFPYQPTEDLVPPPWTAHPGAWERALDLYANRPPQEARRVFLHRDFHPGNVLWSRHRVSGVVDWVSSCVGPPEVDVAHCRYNLAVNAGSMAAADRFLAIWQSMTGSGDYHPYWDLTTIVSVVPAEPSRALDAFAAAAANRLVG